MNATIPCSGGAYEWLSQVPADTGSLSSTLLKLNVHGQRLADFPLAMMQLTALKSLDASENEIVVLPAPITALSRLTELRLGRCKLDSDLAQLHGKRSLEVRALGDLSGFPALCDLSLAWCEVRVCSSFSGAMRHASLTSLCFTVAHPAPESAAVVLQLSSELNKLGRGGGLQLQNGYLASRNKVSNALINAGGRAPFNMFMTALELCGVAWHAP